MVSKSHKLCLLKIIIPIIADLHNFTPVICYVCVKYVMNGIIIVKIAEKSDFLREDKISCTVSETVVLLVK